MWQIACSNSNKTILNCVRFVDFAHQSDKTSTLKVYVVAFLKFLFTNKPLENNKNFKKNLEPFENIEQYLMLDTDKKVFLGKAW